VEHPGKSSVGLQPVSVCCAQVIPLFLISGFLLTCVSGNLPFGLRIILSPKPMAAIDKNIPLKIRSFRNILI
jgi:hypothetical protein